MRRPAQDEDATGKAGRVVHHVLTTRGLFKLVVEAIAEEDRALQGLLRNRSGYEQYAHGIAALFETGAVYAIFRKLVTSLPEPWVVDWEAAHGVGNKKIDLVLRRRGRVRSPVWGIEAKWWTKGGYNIATDCAKLVSATRITRAFLLVLRVCSRRWSLQRLLTRDCEGGHLSLHEVAIIDADELDVLAWGGQPAKLGVALLEVGRR